MNPVLPNQNSIQSSTSAVRSDQDKHNATAITCCISAAGHKLKLYQLSQGKTNRSLKKFKKYKSVILELSGTSQSLAWFKVNHLIRYINTVIKPYTYKRKSLLIMDQATWHKDEQIEQPCNKNKIDLMYVPERCTEVCIIYFDKNNKVVCLHMFD